MKSGDFPTIGDWVGLSRVESGRVGSGRVGPEYVRNLAGQVRRFSSTTAGSAHPDSIRPARIDATREEPWLFPSVQEGHET